MEIRGRILRVALAFAVVGGLTACQVSDPKRVDLLSPKADLTLSAIYSDVPFGNLASQTLDMYAPSGTKNGGIIVWLHGGGWTGGDTDEISPIAAWMVRQRGWTLLSVNYRSAETAPFPAAVEDVKLAIRWAKVNGPQHGLDPQRVFVMGWSAGGHLAALAATTDGVFEPTDVPDSLRGISSRPTAAVSLNGPLDPKTFATTGTWNPEGNRRSISRLLGCTDDVSIDSCPTTAESLAPATYADAGDAPIYIAAGDLDPITSLKSQALDPAAALTRLIGTNKVWLDVVDTGNADLRAHSIDYSLNRWALEQFFKRAPGL